MRFAHRFRVRAPIAAVSAFHRQSASMGAITPPPVIVCVHSAPRMLGEGDRMDFTLWLGPLPLHWIAAIDQVSPHGFVDRQIQGPFASWVHRHHFVALGENETEVVDMVKAELRARGWLSRSVGAVMWLNLPILFAYRAWKTRRLLMTVD